MFIHTGMVRPLEFSVHYLYGFGGSSKQYMSLESCGMTISIELLKLFSVSACLFIQACFDRWNCPFSLCMALLGPQNSI